MIIHTGMYVHLVWHSHFARPFLTETQQYMSLHVVIVSQASQRLFFVQMQKPVPSKEMQIWIPTMHSHCGLFTWQHASASL
jgi:hypothetical protein